MYDDWIKLATKHLKEKGGNLSHFELFNNEQFKNLFANAASCILVINHAEHCYEFVSENIKYILGYEAKEFYEGKVKFGVSHLHPRHEPIFTNQLLPKMFSAIDEHKKLGLIDKLRITINFRYKRKDGAYIWVSEQMSVLETDQEGNALLTLWFLSDITQTKAGDGVEIAVARRDDSQYYKPLYYDSYYTEKQTGLTSRELELLSLISSGKSSKEIAAILNISEHTVGTHRKNMLKKMNVGNTAELLRLAISKGLL